MKNQTAQQTTKEKIICLLKEDANLTRAGLAKKLGKSDATIKEHLAELKKEGKIIRVGSTKSGY